MSQRSSPSDLSLAADAVSELACLVASRNSLKGAVLAWERVAPDPCRGAIAALRRQLLLSNELDNGPDRRRDPFLPLLHPIVAAAADADRRSASACVLSLRSSAASMRSRAARLGDASASTSGAVLSGRMVAGLPLVFLLLAPLGERPRLDPAGIATFAAGLLLIIAGMRWMTRVMPEPPRPSVTASVVRDLAAQLRSGIPATAALESQAVTCRWRPLHRAARLRHLGLTWDEALASSGDRDAMALAAILAATRRHGRGVAAALETFGAELAEEEQRLFEHRLRRAPVLMVLPLAFCLLPGFALLTLGPFLRSMLP